MELLSFLASTGSFPVLNSSDGLQAEEILTPHGQNLRDTYMTSRSAMSGQFIRTHAKHHDVDFHLA